MAESPIVVLEVRVPRKLYEALERAASETGLRVEDIVARALVKALEELGVSV